MISSMRINQFQKLLQKHHALAYIKSFLQNKKNPLNSSYIVLFSLHKSNRLRMKSNLNERFIGCPVIMTNFLCVEFKSFCACCWYLFLINAEKVFVTLSFISSHFYNTNHIQNTIIFFLEVWLPSAHTAAKRWSPSLQDDAAPRRWKRRQIDETRPGASPWSNRLSCCLYVLQALGNPTTPVYARYSSLGLNWGSSSWQFWDSSQRTTSLTLGPYKLTEFFLE